MKLSELKNGDVFKFKEGEVAHYRLTGLSHRILNHAGHMEFEAMYCNPKSVKVRMIGGKIDYQVNFGGYISQTERGNDCEVIKTT